MPYSFTKIEKDKTQSIKIVFAVLVLFYFVTFFFISLLVKNFYVYEDLKSLRFVFFTPVEMLGVLILAFVSGAMHWVYTTSHIIPRIIGLLKAEKLNLNDEYHKRFRNIVDEVSVATGGTKINAVIVPTMAMNAFSISDFNDCHVIGVTEGLLSRLTRAQVEAVVAHEAGHILSGDCLSTTMTASLFEIFNVALKLLQQVTLSEATFSGYRSRSGNYRVRPGGSASGGILILLIYVSLSISKSMSTLLRMFISREREYRADAISARLTRNPLALAESLHSMTYHWRGTGLALEELDSIFMISPQTHIKGGDDETISDDLFQTHPPVEKRIKILLDMAHGDLKTVVKSVKSKNSRPRKMPPQVSGSAKPNYQWMVQRAGNWSGPFDLKALKLFDWFMPETWVKREGQDAIQMAREDHTLESVFYPDKAKRGQLTCPKCDVAFISVYYEGVRLHKCPTCHGNFVHERDIQRIIIREEIGFSDEVKRMAGIIEKQSKMLGGIKIDRSPDSLYRCPKCLFPKTKMLRTFYTEAYKVEIDKCFACGYVFFDDHELEVVQYMIEKRCKI